MKRTFIHDRRYGFTLVELLTVIGIVILLLSLLLPSLRQARHQARKVVCLSNLRQIGTAIHAYAQDYNDTIPFGPEGLPMMGSNFYTVTGSVTSLLSLLDGRPVGLGLLLDTYLSSQPKVLFCPGADQPSEADLQLSRVGRWQAQCDYYYRHASVAILTGTPEKFSIKLSRLGTNRNGQRIRSLVMDVQFLAHPCLSSFGVVTRTSHLRKVTNLLYADGAVRSQDNSDGRFTVDVGAYPYDALDEILRRFELADELE
ncbi:MAG TPA: DUF1559 domain-containing protein [Anaerohalosphaeraceae bacterium]|jgi:hypothetical protein|nr:DUF1559 domain-containing protein [Anaerohalosphaeraceae bacterium]HPB93080.1 DUF1559 domain-containing protein [Anaerohalosphaeraceae bacterium]HRT23369.1 DUF1559 domain-containing protein [Anaerohalosphaeraceae bacterium]HRU14987.1 DUF1559 domain-containing protein [Anaerohalosphaeraceae bacterium]